MQARHLPTINPRYWTGIALASIFGTNMGDFYAHEAGLGLLGGLPILIGLFLLVFIAERFDKLTHEAYYWLCIIIMRTGATNIADYMAGRHGMHIDRLVLSLSFGAAIAVLALWAYSAARAKNEHLTPKSMPDTDARYWVTMLLAGIFGTVLGDYFEKTIGENLAALVLPLVLAGALLLYRQKVMSVILGYWLVVGVARTAGTAIGDWFADNKAVGLPLSTLCSGLVFVGVLVLWRTGKRQDDPALAV
ncbi:MAG TPA: hypothetical protein VMU59_15560 [Caulobacteraceae bacterium]|nr:hypothetical protein [Caulobacteraceae bacterium]